MRFILRGIVVLLTIAFAISKQCSNSRVAPQYQRKFADMNEGDLLVEVRFRPKRKRFEVIRLWNGDGESLDLNRDIRVNVDDAIDSTAAGCFNELSNERYLLALSSNSAGYFPLLPPLPIKKHAKRHEIWNGWCNASHDNCKLTISRAGFPPLLVFERRAMVLVTCHVSSKYPITSIRWKKDGRFIEEKIRAVFYAGNGIFVHRVNLEDGKSELVISDASAIDTGIYSCVASDSNGAEVEMKSEFALRGDNSVFTTCPAGKEDYCLSGSTCQGIVGLRGEAVCLCPPGFEGKRCHSLIIDHPEEAGKNQEDIIDRLENTTVILSIVAILTGICLIVALVSLYRVRKRRRNSGSYESPTEIEKTADTDIEAGSESIQKI